MYSNKADDESVPCQQDIEYNELTVASAGVRALNLGDRVEGSTVGGGVTTVALLRPLNSSVLEALATAESGARVQSHGLGISVGSTGECTAVSTLSNTTNLSPAGKQRLLGVHKGGSRGAIGASGLGTGACPDRVATRESRDGSSVTNGLIDNLTLVKTGGGSGIVLDGGEGGAIIDVTGSVGAVVDQLGDEIRILPTHGKVTVVSQTGGVTVGQNPGTGTPVWELVNGSKHFVENRNDVDRVRSRAGTVVVVGSGVRHVGLVVGRIEVDTVPASREEDLKTHTIGAVVVEEIGTLSPVGVVVVGTAVVYEGRMSYVALQNKQNKITYPSRRKKQPGPRNYWRCRHAC